jgi:sec-independent protein translocase protein TatA
MFSDLFDSPWKILIVAVVLIVLFGSKKLPDTARSLGKSMRILKTEFSSMHEDEAGSGLPAQAPGALRATPVSVPSEGSGSLGRHAGPSPVNERVS